MEMSGNNNNENNQALHHNDTEASGAEIFITILATIFWVITFPLTFWSGLNITTEFERSIVFRCGRLVSNKTGPGLVIVNPFIDSLSKVDLRVKSFEVPEQHILTSDSLSISVNGVVFFQIFDPIRSVVNVTNANHAVENLAQTSIRNLVGTHTLHEILHQKDQLSQRICETLSEATTIWGIKVHRVELKDVFLPQSLTRAMAIEAEATREARAKVIIARGEEKAAVSLREASDLMMESPAALHLRYLQTIEEVSASRNHTIIVPLPTELLNALPNVISRGLIGPVNPNSDNNNNSPPQIL